uniref:Uncharacterized protein n=1 Tax=Romanomermis culicivorax TaxID=13658 RepID=A0A915IB83_ROMCU
MPKFSNYSNVEEYAQMLGKCLTEKIREVKGSLVLVCWSSMCSLAMRVASKVLFSALVCFSCPMSAPVVQEQIIQYSKTNIPTIFIVGEKAVVDVDLSFLKEKDGNFAVICARNSRFDLNMDVGKLCTENVTQNLVDEQLMLYIHRFLSKALPCRLKAE